jgi:hypothetical protein
MSNYIVTVNIREDLEVTANSAEEAVRSIELISNDENQINIEILNVTEVRPPSPVSTYTSLKSIYAPTSGKPEYTKLAPSTNAYRRLV